MNGLANKQVIEIPFSIIVLKVNGYLNLTLLEYIFFFRSLKQQREKKNICNDCNMTICMGALCECVKI